MQEKDQRQNYSISFLTVHTNTHKIILLTSVGGIAGICGKSATAPFERIKMLYVTRDRRFNYREALKDVIYIYKQHGFFNFWRGNSAMCMRVFPFAAINFSVFDFMRKNFHQKVSDNNTTKKQLTLLFCGSVAGATAGSICYPLEFMWTRLAMQKDNFAYKNFFSAFTSILKNEGILAFYQGLNIAICGIIFYHGVGFFVFTNLKQNMLKSHPQYAKRWYFDFCFGATGAVVGQAMGYPFDILRKRMQAQALLFHTKEISVRQNLIQMIPNIYNNEGIIRGFYKGFSVNLIKSPIANGMAWAIKNILNRSIDQAYDF